MSDINRDDVRAAVGAGMISEAQAASLLALSDARRGTREHMTGLDEPFELFRGFNEIFIVVGLVVLYAGWLGITGVSIFSSVDQQWSFSIFGLISMLATGILARYFTIQRRMVAPSIALSIMFGLGALQFGAGLGFILGTSAALTQALAAAIATLLLAVYYVIFRVPFSIALLALGVFATCFAFFSLNGATDPNFQDLFLLTADGPFAILTIGLGIIGLIIALRFDMSDPHRITRRSASGFWLHVVAAPAIVNTVALTLFQAQSLTAQIVLVLFISLMALFAVIIDRRSFLVSGVGYVVALSLTVMEGGAFAAILLLGLGLVLLGAYWEVLRGSLMKQLPDFPGKDRLPPWALMSNESTS
jgi:hypothetical protein